MIGPGERRATALLLLAAMSILPVLAIVEGIQAHDRRFLLVGAVLFPLFALAPVLYGLGIRWAASLGLYTAGTGLLVGLLNAIRLGGEKTALLGMVPFALAAYLFYRGRRRKIAAGAEKPPSPKEALAHWLRENVEAIAVAFMMALIIRCFFIEVFKIPSSSMEPTLLGDFPTATHQACSFQHYHRRPEGDRIMVTKFSYLFDPVERYDVVVFKFPLELSRNFIKRVVQLPDEVGFIYGGNLYVRKKGGRDPRFTITRKPPLTQAALWIIPEEVRSFLADRDVFLQTWKPDPPEARFDVGAGTLVISDRASFRYDRPITNDGGAPVGDAMISFRVTPEADGRVFAAIENELGRFELSLAPSGSEIVHIREGHRESHPVSHVRLDAGRPADVMFMVYDGQAILRIDGRMQPPVEVLRHFFDGLPLPSSTVVSFGAERGARIAELRVGRDIYYEGRPRPEGNIADGRAGRIETGPDQYVMFGDNVSNSHDSRRWKELTYRLKDGRTVICEGQADKSDDERAKEVFRRAHGLKTTPDYYITADRFGHEWYFERSDLDPRYPQPAKRDFIQVQGKHIVGKAFWIWWPLPRSFRMIR